MRENRVTNFFKQRVTVVADLLEITPESIRKKLFASNDNEVLYFAQEVTSRMLAEEMAAQEEGKKEADELATQ